MLEIIIGTKNGEIRLGPFSRYVLCCCWVISKPPMPQPMITPARYGSTSFISEPQSASASLAATTANWVNRSIWRISFFSRWSAGSKPRTIPATLMPTSVGSNLSILEMPSLPCLTFSQNVFASLPSGLTVPTPVITTLFIFFTFLSKSDYMERPPEISMT